jgi:hypothetical protein
VSTVGTRNGQVVLVRPNGEAIAYPERKKRSEPARPKINAERKNGMRYVFLQRTGRNTAYRQVRDALDHADGLVAAAVGKFAGVKEPTQRVGGGKYTRSRLESVTGQLMAEGPTKGRNKHLRKGDVVTVHVSQEFTLGGIVDVTDGDAFHVDADDTGPLIMKDNRYFGPPFTAGQGGVKVKGVERGYVSAFGPKSTNKKKHAPRKGRQIERG